MNHDHHHEIGSAEETKALLEYMVKHNTSHTEELEHLAQHLNGEGKKEAFSLINKALEDYRKGNALISEALKKLTEGD